MRDPLGFVDGLRRRWGRYARFRIGPDPFVLVSDPAGISEVFVERHRELLKGPGYDGVRVVLGSGLLTSEGELWQQRRRLAQPSFRPEALAAFEAEVVAAVDAAHERWAVAGRPLDLQREMAGLTLDVVGRTLFGRPFADRIEPLAEAIDAGLAFAWTWGNDPVRLPLWMPTPSRWRLARARRTLAGIAAEARAGAAPGTFARTLVDAEAEGRVDAAGVADEVTTMLLAGHETSASALVFAFALLNRDRAWKDAVRRGGHGRGSPAAAAWCETLRLRPPSWFLERRGEQPFEVGGYEVPVGTTVAVSPWVVHRDPELWPRPEVFDPGRFPDGAPSREQRGAWFPFGSGPRTCIGMRLANLEAAIVLSRTLERFDLVPEDPEPTPVARITLRPTRYRVRFVPRSR